MSKPEIELKLPIFDSADFESRLRAHGYRVDTPRTFEHNTLYDTPSRDLRARTEILRIRRYGALCTVTHKRTTTHQNPTESSRYKVRIETETTVADGDALATIFTHLGYGPAFTYEKYRTEWSHPDEPTCHIVLDETPIGTYAELEGPPAWIDRTVIQLGLDPSTCLTDSYGKLFLDWKQRTGNPAENLTFAEIAPALASH
jgi:adenylate cyclase class 2